MKDKTAVKERLIQFLAYKNIGQNKFEKESGISNGYISHVKSSIGSDVLTKIISVYSDLNIIWLLTGNGEMLNAETKEHGASPCLQCALKDAENTRLKDKIIELQERLLNGAEPKKAQKAG